MRYQTWTLTGLLLLICSLSWAAPPPISPTDPSPEITPQPSPQKMAPLSGGIYQKELVPLKPIPTYPDYNKQTREIIEMLLRLKPKLEDTYNPLPFQVMAASTHGLEAEYQRLLKLFHHGETQYQSFKLISKAVNTLTQLIEYQRLADYYRPVRGTEAQKVKDEQMTASRIQTVIDTIEQLKESDQISKSLERK